MKLSKIIKLGKNHILNTFWEFLYLKTGIDHTKPNTFYGIITNKCNSKCIYCHYWQLKDSEELTIEEWKKILLDTKKFVGNYSINFSGGEPLLKNGFFDLLDFLNKNKINFGVTTNASLLENKEMAKKLVLAKPMNVNISCESIDPKIHDYIRGWEGLHEKIMKAIQNLQELQKENNIHFPIIMKATINSLNYKQLPDQAEWVKKMGLAGITMQPIGPWTEKAEKELYIKGEEIKFLKKIIDILIKMKEDGSPIMNSVSDLNSVIPYFSGEQLQKESGPCRVGLRNAFIYPNGDIYVCTSMSPIGNVKDKTLKEVWYSNTAKKIRKNTVNCKKICLSACSSNKTLFDKAKIAFRLFRNK